MKEIVVISGKGGTGKTSLTASFAVLADRPVIADCDVDAADLHLVLSPRIRETREFLGGHTAVIRQDDCTGCGLCLERCRFDAVRRVRSADGGKFEASTDCLDCEHCERSCLLRTNAIVRELRKSVGSATFAAKYAIDPTACEGCGVCVRFCPVKAIEFEERLCGEWMISDTRYGPMVHARLSGAAENSGKLVATLRREAKRIAVEGKHELILIDGPPGIGCPVIASVTGTSLVLVVTEPTVSGEHDLERVLSLTRHFGIPSAVCVNKWDINPEMTERIEARARRCRAAVAGRVRYDTGVTRAQVQARTVVETDTVCAEDIRNLWKALSIQEDQAEHGMHGS